MSSLPTPNETNPPNADLPEPGELGRPLHHPDERRSSQLLDRRSDSRRGKYDRRRNRCAHCKHFIPPGLMGPVATEGFCQQHRVPLPPHAYACRWFERGRLSFEESPTSEPGDST